MEPGAVMKILVINYEILLFKIKKNRWRCFVLSFRHNNPKLCKIAADSQLKHHDQADKSMTEHRFNDWEERAPTTLLGNKTIVSDGCLERKKKT